MTIVMGLDQHRAQITAEWIDTSTGEVSRQRVSPAHRAGVRRFLAPFRGGDLEVALEATTGWRFVVEELQAIGAHVHLAEPAETAARRGTKKRAKSDRADARHLRELLMVGRLPESWIPPAHLLDLRAQVRLRHTLVDQRREWQQRMQAVLYHHGVPQRSWLMSAESRAWLAGLVLPAGGARADHRRAGADRRARCAARTARPEATRLCQTSARLPGADASLRDRTVDGGHDPGRAR
jgi:transposase